MARPLFATVRAGFLGMLASLAGVAPMATLVGGVAGAFRESMAQSKVMIDGSSTVQPVTAKVAEAFEQSQQGIKVEVGTSGTGGGFKKFLRGAIDITNASRPILAKEMKEAKEAGIEYLEIPIAFDALTVMVHPSNTFVDNLTVAELKKVWEPDAQGKIMTWNQVRSSWPNQPLTLYGPGTDSGTFDYFTEAVVGKAKASRSDYTPSENDNMLAQGISRDANSLGYFGFAYYSANKGELREIPVVNPKTGKPVTPSEATVIDGSYVPLARPLFIYVNKRSMEEKPEVRRFVQFYLTRGAPLVREVGYVPLPEAAYAQAMQRVKNLETGTAFGGHSIAGLHVDEMFSRPLGTEEIMPASHGEHTHDAAKDAKKEASAEGKDPK